MRRSRIWRAADAFMLLAFLLSVAVQVNDPDPLPWIAIYALAAGACGLSLLGRGGWHYPAVIAVMAVAWAVRIAPRVVGDVPFADMFGAFEMESVAVEEAREMYGLLVIAVWMSVLTLRWRRRPSP